MGNSGAKYLLISLTLMIISGIGLCMQLPNIKSIGTSLINGTSVYSITVSLEPITVIISSVITTIAAIIGLYGYFKDYSEERRWKGVVIK